jgi:hypothetical protein
MPRLAKSHDTRAGVAELAFAEQHAHGGGRAVAVLGQALDDHRHPVRREALVGDDLVLHVLVEQAGAAFDRSLDRVARHRGLLGGLHRDPQARVAAEVGAALGGHGDLLGQLGQDLALGVAGRDPARVLPLCAHGALITRRRTRPANPRVRVG